MPQADNKPFWQRFAKLYAPFMASNKAVYEAICAHIAPCLSQDMAVLELACGSGQLSFPLATHVKRWEATDFSPAMIAEAQKRPCPAQLTFSVCDATDLPYAAGSFDAVVIANALHIMPHPEAALAEIHRVLRPGGTLFAPTFVHGSSTGSRIRTRLMTCVGFRVYSDWTEDALAAYICAHGFTVSDTKLLGSNIVPLCSLIATRCP